MTKEQTEREAERICNEMENEYGMAWMADDAGTPHERIDWIEKISTALMEATKEPTA